ncbi:hypothetical protein [Gordonia polyisoprenivorans]|uniref:hypothetical protein n=1 Tax=Gordonia polyisoprenivorans TaxID=84595 RepID=UPI0005BB87A8|nr:hypothetical protein [Gordonia polyisoprenivorans]
MEDTWTNRDLPVLRAAVRLYDEYDLPPSAEQIEAECGLDDDTVQRALKALYREPFFEKGIVGGGEIRFVGKPTGEAQRVAGMWPSPTTQLERLIAALQAVADDDSRPDEERSRFRQVALLLGGAASQIAIGALGGAGGNLLSG